MKLKLVQRLAMASLFIGLMGGAVWADQMGNSSESYSYYLKALVEESQRNVTGTVKVKLYKGGMYTAGRRSKVSLYNPHIATMEADPTKAYNQDDATGFIRLNGLRLRVASRVQGAKALNRVR